MKNIKLLDCTLRDGGRLFNCEFSDEMILDMRKRLEKAGIDIIEMGFLRDDKLVTYEGNSTFFTDTAQMSCFLQEKAENCLYVAFIDYGMFDFAMLRDNDGTSVDGIRFGYTHKNIIEHKEDVLECMRTIKRKGYKLLIQNVNTPGYTDRELLDMIGICNELHPYSYGIVDTYGCMYLDDLRHYYDLIDRNLDEDICVDFHSHNNFQMSFALAQEIISLAEGKSRTVVIDATLNGMGKGAGNLSTELIVEYLIRAKDYNYDLDVVLDIIDDYLKDIRKSNSWGYTVPAMLSGIYRAHPNNMIYLTDKYDMSARDIRVILSTLKPEERLRYDYEKLNRLCEIYKSTKLNDEQTVEDIRKELNGRTVLAVMPGGSIKDCGPRIQLFIREQDPVVLSVNFAFKREDGRESWSFFGSADRYRRSWRQTIPKKTILTSNIKGKRQDEKIVNYESLVERMNTQFDNSAIMCLNLLKKCGVKRIVLAGFDGYSDNMTNYYESSEFQTDVLLGKMKEMNHSVQELFSHFYRSVYKEICVEFLTPSKYVIPEI